MTRTKRVMSVVAVLALALSLAAPAWALGDVDPTAEAAIEVSAADEVFRRDLADTAITVLVYKLAGVNEHGLFTPEAAFASLAENIAWNGGQLNGSTDLKALIDEAEAVIFPEETEPDEDSGTDDPLYEAEPALEPLFTAEIDAEGSTLALQNAEAAYGLGLYLLVPRKAQTTQWVYTFSPLLVAVPSIRRQASMEGGLPTEGEWEYDVPAQIKATRIRRLTDIVIAKTLQEYNATLGATTFLFDVQADIDGEHVFSQLVPLTFSGTGTQSVTVSGIPVGARVTVTEVYSGASYEVVGGQVTVEVPELPLPSPDAVRVDFTNTYTDRQNPDTSLVNTWVREGAGWTWQSGEEAG